jgi:hypothetical protein
MLSTPMRFIGLSIMAFMLAFAAGCSNGPTVDPADIGFKNYYLCTDPADVVEIGQRANAQECFAACETASQQLLNGKAQACWWLDGSAGLPVACRLCKTKAPTKDVFFNNWAITLPGAGPPAPDTSESTEKSDKTKKPEKLEKPEQGESKAERLEDAVKAESPH